ncbi:MAG: LacI family DNA-binding transcriptional regulator [Schaedlerella sp.]|nr:LacI family DNA-binding transcriptional regulator [Schaedlerella sp.]
MNKKTTLKDIAGICGCSVTTVARALKDSDTISAAMRKKIQDTALELGYIPNSLATSMRTGRTNTIGVILQDFRNPYFAVIAKYIEEYARIKNYSIFFMTTNESSVRELEACRSMIGKNVDGILLFPVQEDDRSVQLLLSQSTPFVLVSRYFEHLDTSYVVSDEEAGTYMVTKHLIEKGAQNIVFLNGPEYIYSAHHRQIGYLRALNESGLSPNIIPTGTKIGETAEQIHNLENNKIPYDGILTFCDMMGYEAYHTLSDLGYQIPGDKLLAGHDGLHQDMIYPLNLTTAMLDRQQLAHAAIDMILDIIENPDSEKQQVCLKQTLFIGDTTT